jgi:hypothetical protein
VVSCNTPRGVSHVVPDQFRKEMAYRYLAHALCSGALETSGNEGTAHPAAPAGCGNGQHPKLSLILLGSELAPSGRRRTTRHCAKDVPVFNGYQEFRLARPTPGICQLCLIGAVDQPVGAPQ